MWKNVIRIKFIVFSIPLRNYYAMKRITVFVFVFLTLFICNGFSSSTTWCVARPSTPQAELVKIIDYACELSHARRQTSAMVLLLFTLKLLSLRIFTILKRESRRWVATLRGSGWLSTPTQVLGGVTFLRMEVQVLGQHRPILLRFYFSYSFW